VHAAVRQQVTGDRAYAELLQAGRIGLWRAILGYDVQRGTTFATYAWPCIVRAIWRAAKRRPPRCGGLPVGFSWAADPALRYEAQVVRRELRGLVPRLPARLHTVIVARYGLHGLPPATYQQIGTRLGVTRERARQLHQEALLWLQQPAHSQRLRSLLGRHTLAEYQAAATRRAQWHARRRQRDAGSP
jgi:RNA polymerase sigma factor (sigma-70 family)